MSCPSSGTIVIAGGSGFLGTSLAEFLTATGWQVVVLSRSPARQQRSWQTIAWDARCPGEWCAVLEGARAVVNLAGRSVDCIKTPDHCDEILRSRIEATRVLGAAMARLAVPPPVWIQMSTAHIYGDPPQARCTEAAATGYGLAPDVGRAWEAELSRAQLPGQRAVILRTGFVLGRDRGAGGGALSRLAGLASMGLGGRVGSGCQGFSWLHEADWRGIVARAITDARMQGIYNVTAPEPVSQQEFMRTLRVVRGSRIGLPAWSWMVRIGAPLLLRTDPELALYGRYVLPQRLLDQGYEFLFPRLEPALADLFRTDGRRPAVA